MDDAAREMTLQEWVNLLPPHHTAAREFARLREENERLREERDTWERACGERGQFLTARESELVEARRERGEARAEVERLRTAMDADKRRLAREIDVALNGAGAALEPAMVDVLASAQQARAELARLREESRSALAALREHRETVEGLGDAAEQYLGTMALRDLEELVAALDRLDREEASDGE